MTTTEARKMVQAQLTKAREDVFFVGLELKQGKELRNIEFDIADGPRTIDLLRFILADLQALEAIVGDLADHVIHYEVKRDRHEGGQP